MRGCKEMSPYGPATTADSGTDSAPVAEAGAEVGTARSLTGTIKDKTGLPVVGAKE